MGGRMGISIPVEAMGFEGEDSIEYESVEYESVDEIPQIVFAAMKRQTAEFTSVCKWCGRAFMTARPEPDYECRDCMTEDTSWWQ